MIMLPKTLDVKKVLFLIVVFLITTNIVIFFDIPVLRQVLGFIFLTIIPGLLILYILQMNKIGLTEKFILSVGLSISFLMFAGLLINWIYPAFGYRRPLSTNSLLISFSAIILILAIVVYLRNQDASIISISDFKLNTTEKAFLLIPVLFLPLSILGMHIMNTTDNNTMLLVLLFLIPAYVIFMAIKQIPDRVYPPIILLISISLVLLMGLRSSYIMGDDVHLEYNLFRQTFYNGLWQIGIAGLLDACLSVSILPTIYQSFLDIDSQYLMKILYPILFSFSPLVVYIISRKYISNRYAFLASFFFMSQPMFLMVTAYSRTSLAILFFGLAIMTLLSDRLDELNKRLLFLIFAFSCIVSHYSTSYVFFFILLFSWIGMQIIPRIVSFRNSANPLNPTSQATATTLKTHQPLLRNRLTSGIVILFFTMIFFWYSQVTGVAFDMGVRFVATTLEHLHEFFILEMRGMIIVEAFGRVREGISWQILFVFYWLTIAFIAIGLLVTLAKYFGLCAFADTEKKVSSEFSPQKIDTLFLILAFCCFAIMAVSVVLPFVFVGYSVERAYTQMLVTLSPFFIIGGIEVARFLRVKRTYLVILMVLIPFFMCMTGTVHEIFSEPWAITLNSEGESYDLHYVHEQEVHAARWLNYHRDQDLKIYADHGGRLRLVSQTEIPHLAHRSILKILNVREIPPGYIFLRYYNVVVGEIFCHGEVHNTTKYLDIFIRKNRIYDNGVAQVLGPR